MGIIISFSIAASMVFGTIAGTRQVKAEHVTLYYSNLPEQFTGYKIFLFTDTHLGGIQNPKPLFNKAQKILAASNPDMILFAGDLVNNFANEVPGNEHFFKRLNENRKSYSILGNHDYGDYTDWENDEEKEANFRALIEAHGELGFTLLRNENVSIVKQNDTIFLAGVENWGHPPFPQYADLEAAIQGIPPGAFTILLTHDPAHWESKIRNQENIELTLSGHTHGMQWGIKIAGIPFSLAYLSRKYWGGLYKSGNSALYVNTGFGTVGVPWRLDMPAEVTILTLERLKVD